VVSVRRTKETVARAFAPELGTGCAKAYCAVALRISFSSSESPCAPSALHANATPTPEPGRYLKNALETSKHDFTARSIQVFPRHYAAIVEFNLAVPVS